MIKEKIKLIKEKKLSAEENIKKFIDKIKKENKEFNIVLHLNERAIEQAMEIDLRIRKKEKTGKLAGLGFLVKSNINVEGLICNCASKTLENYKSGFNSTAVQKLIDEDAVVLGMVNMDEFACGSSGESSAFGACKNSAALDRIPGGSLRNPASHCRVVGLKPSYGAVSRYGLIDLSMSLDQIGVLGKTSEDCALIFEIIKGKDFCDAVSRDFSPEKKDLKKVRIGVLKINADKRILDKVLERVKLVAGENSFR